MKLSHTLLALALAMTSGSALAAGPASFATNGLPSIPANRIVGVWALSGSIGPCGGTANPLIAYNVYHAGGTWSDAGNTPPTSRGQGQGVWQYLGNGQYETHLQFFRFTPDGMYAGISDVRTVVQLNGSSQFSNTIHARLLNTGGVMVAELCGSAMADRIGIQ